VDLPRIFTIRESSHRLDNPFTSEKLAILGQALRLEPGATLLDLACGKGELLCTWARDYKISGTGVDISTVFINAARERAAGLDVADSVTFIHDNASGFVAPERVDVAACIGATWIGSGVPGTIELLERSLRPGGLMLIGEPYWRLDPPDQDAVAGSHAAYKEDFRPLPKLLAQFQQLGWDVVEMVLADQDSWDRYVAAQWMNLRRWLDANPHDELAGTVREELDTAPIRYAKYEREYLGWGVFALLKR
jgi:SAM-dependent methyltransferase